VPTAKSTRLLFTLALLAAALPLLAGRASADEVTLKCTFSLWDDRVEVGEGKWGWHEGCPSSCREPAGAIEERLASAPSQKFEITRIIDLADANRHEPDEEHTISPSSISIRWIQSTVGMGDWPARRKAVALFPGSGLASGYFRIDSLAIERIDLSAKATFQIFLGRAGGRAKPPPDLRQFSGQLGNIIARATVKGTCERVARML
jgi:hypothetical protein